MSQSERTIEELVDGIASERVAPAGGTALAVSGAMGAALCEMCCVHTLARPSADEGGSDDARLAGLRDDLERHRETLLALADRDAAVVDELFGSGSSDAAPGARKRAATVPLAIAETALDVLRAAEAAIALGRGDVVADAETGRYLAESAFRGSVATARRSLALLDDPAAADLRERLDALEAAAAELTPANASPDRPDR